MYSRAVFETENKDSFFRVFNALYNSQYRIEQTITSCDVDNFTGKIIIGVDDSDLENVYTFIKENVKSQHTLPVKQNNIAVTNNVNISKIYITSTNNDLLRHIANDIEQYAIDVYVYNHEVCAKYNNDLYLGTDIINYVLSKYN